MKYITISLCSLAWIASVQAGLIPTNVSITPEGSYYRYTYSVNLQSDVTIVPGDYFTLYDFAGMVDGSATGPDNFAFGSSALGSTPNYLSPNDDASVPNATWTYTGTDPLVGPESLGQFSLLSIYGNPTYDDFTGQTHRTVDGILNSNITETSVPVPAPGVPEPTSLLLLAGAIPLGLWYRSRKS
ncbi:MAG: PEP-CTERM sorting domain-containing protein [Zavarzinella sp.]